MYASTVLRAVALSLIISIPFPASAAPQTGGSTQVAAQPGCMNQWLFNGMWRVRVTSVAPIPAGDGWNVTMQWANGTNIAGVAPMDTMKQDLVLVLANGDTLTASDSTRGALNQQQLDFHTFPASGQFTYTQMFFLPSVDPNNKPVKLLVTFDVPKYRAANPSNSGKYWRQKTAGYNYRIDLTCTK